MAGAALVEGLLIRRLWPQWSGLVAIVFFCGAGRPAALEPAPEPDHVVLLHGLGRADRSMRTLAERLGKRGYEVHNLRYPSTSLDPDALVAFLAAEIELCCEDTRRLHFVGHSLGGILARAYLAEHRPQQLGRVVLLAPPSQGSEVVDRLGGNALFRLIYGPTGVQLGTSMESLPNRLPPPHYELGVIAATRSINPLGSALIPGKDDGAVALARTPVAGMSDYIALNHTHTFIMQSCETAAQVVHFLRLGRFYHRAQESAGGSCKDTETVEGTTGKGISHR